MPKLPSTWLVLATCGILVAVVLVVSSRWQSGVQSGQHAAWEAHLAILSERDATVLVRSLRQRDLQSIPTLVRALADQRPAVVEAAREAVGNLVADWKELPARDSVPRLSALAGQLADHQADFAPAQRQFARQVAQAMLVWPLADADFPADDLVAHCDRILSAPISRPEPDASESTTAPKDALPPIASAQVARRHRPGQAVPLPASPDQQPAAIVDVPSLREVDPDLQGLQPDDSPSVDGPFLPQEPRQFLPPRVPPIPPADLPCR